MPLEHVKLFFNGSRMFKLALAKLYIILNI